MDYRAQAWLEGFQVGCIAFATAFAFFLVLLYGMGHVHIYTGLYCIW